MCFLWITKEKHRKSNLMHVKTIVFPLIVFIWCIKKAFISFSYGVCKIFHFQRSAIVFVSFLFMQYFSIIVIISQYHHHFICDGKHEDCDCLFSSWMLFYVAYQGCLDVDDDCAHIQNPFSRVQFQCDTIFCSIAREINEKTHSHTQKIQNIQ